MLTPYDTLFFIFTVEYILISTLVVGAVSIRYLYTQLFFPRQFLSVFLMI